MVEFTKEVTEDRVVVLVETPPAETPSGILLTTVRKTVPTSGVVVAVGPGKMTKQDVLRPMIVKPQDKVIFAAGSGKPVRIDGQDYLILREEEIFAVVE